MKVAYLKNQYPKVSHTFIRREIEAIKERGFEVERFSIPPTPDRLVNPLDLAKEERTTILLDYGLPTLNSPYQLNLPLTITATVILAASEKQWVLRVRASESYHHPRFHTV